MLDDECKYTKVPIFESILFSYKTFFSNMGYFLYLLFPVGALIFVSDMLQFFGEFHEIYAMQYVFLFVNLVFYSLFAISWHRFIILGKSKSNKASILKLKKHEIIFIAYPMAWLAIAVLALLFFIFLKLAGLQEIIIAPVVFVFLVISIHYIFRLWIFLPAQSIDSGLNMKDVYCLSKGYTIRLLFGFLIISSPLGYLEYTYKYYIYNSYADRLGFNFILEYSLVEIFGLLITLVAIALNAGFISHIFVRIQKEERSKNVD
ncbi:MAG: hypothetical protein ACRBDL_02535 [Alphaproteobacteria bacterium]